MSGLLAKIVCLLGISLLLASTALGDSPCTIDFPHDSNPTEITDEDICNFHQVDPELYRGGQPRLSAYPKLAQVGIRTIVNLEADARAEAERATIAELNRTLAPEQCIDFISFHITQTQIGRTGISHQQVQNLFGQIQKARKPVFIHCFHGKDRTGAIVAIYRMWRQQKSYNEALDEALHYKFNLRDPGLIRTIDRYKNPKKLHSLPRP